jgi:hypothetical protein
MPLSHLQRSVHHNSIGTAPFAVECRVKAETVVMAELHLEGGGCGSQGLMAVQVG